MTPVHYDSPVKGAMPITKRLGIMQREIAKRRIDWPMDKPKSGDDYRRWACGYMAGVLRHMAENLECTVPDAEIGQIRPSQ